MPPGLAALQVLVTVWYIPDAGSPSHGGGEALSAEFRAAVRSFRPSFLTESSLRARQHTPPASFSACSHRQDCALPRLDRRQQPRLDQHFRVRRHVSDRPPPVHVSLATQPTPRASARRHRWAARCRRTLLAPPPGPRRGRVAGSLDVRPWVDAPGRAPRSAVLTSSRRPRPALRLRALSPAGLSPTTRTSAAMRRRTRPARPPRPALATPRRPPSRPRSTTRSASCATTSTRLPSVESTSTPSRTRRVRARARAKWVVIRRD